MAFPLDRRTRRNSDIRSVAPLSFFAHDFAALAERHGALVAVGVEQLDVPPLTVAVSGDSWTVVAGHGSVEVVPGPVDGALVMTLTEDQFSDWAQDLRSINALLVAEELAYEGGSARDLSVWDSLWRCLLDGWAVVGAPDFVDRRGRPLDLDRIFTPDDDPADLAHFVREAGFLHLRGWLDPVDVLSLSEEIDAALAHYSEGDGRSWWAELVDGSRSCVRMQQFVDHSPTTAKVLASERWTQMVDSIAADDDELVQGRPGNQVTEALVKPVGVVAGISNLTFHRDCHFGRHAYGCSGVDLGITVTPSGPDNGSLRVVAGSHRIAVPVEVANTDPYLPVVAVATDAGDCTVHLSCTLHESTAPLIDTRKVMYTPYRLPAFDDDTPPPPDPGGPLREKVHERFLDAGGTA